MQLPKPIRHYGVCKYGRINFQAQWAILPKNVYKYDFLNVKYFDQF